MKILVNFINHLIILVYFFSFILFYYFNRKNNNFIIIKVIIIKVTPLFLKNTINNVFNIRIKLVLVQN